MNRCRQQQQIYWHSGWYKLSQISTMTEKTKRTIPPRGAIKKARTKQIFLIRLHTCAFFHTAFKSQ